MRGPSRESIVDSDERSTLRSRCPGRIRRPDRGHGREEDLASGRRYAQACSLFPTPDLEHELDLLRGHCHAGGREYDQIEKTVMYPLNPGPNGENVDAILVELQRLARLGISYVHSRVTDVALSRPPELLGERVIPVAAEF